MVIEKISVTKTFTEEEKTQIADTLIETIQKKQEVELVKKSVTSEYNSQIKELTIQVNQLAHKHKLGYEDYGVECEVRPDFAAGIKNYYERESGLFMKSAPLTDDDRQLHIEDMDEE